MATPEKTHVYNHTFEIDPKVQEIIKDSEESKTAYLEYLVFSQS